MKEYMHNFTNLGDNLVDIERLFDKLYKENKGDKNALKELKDMMEVKMFDTWKDKTLDCRAAYLYKNLYDRI